MFWYQCLLVIQKFELIVSSTLTDSTEIVSVKNLVPGWISMIIIVILIYRKFHNPLTGNNDKEFIVTESTLGIYCYYSSFAGNSATSSLQLRKYGGPLGRNHIK